MTDWHLAQLKVGRMVADETSPVVAEFIDALDEISAVADAAPGFVWRFQTEEGNAIAERPFPDDDQMLVNFSTWTSVEALADYVFRTVHGDEASDDDLAAMHFFYCRTFGDYGNHPALTLEFFRHLARSMPRQLVLFLAERGGEAVAGALCLRGGDTLYGRYWGSSEP